MSPCPDTAERPPTVSWRVTAEHGRAFVFTIIDSAWHWRIADEGAVNSRAYPSYPAALAAARTALGLPAIGQHSSP